MLGKKVYMISCSPTFPNPNNTHKIKWHLEKTSKKQLKIWYIINDIYLWTCLKMGYDTPQTILMGKIIRNHHRNHFFLGVGFASFQKNTRSTKHGYNNQYQKHVWYLMNQWIWYHAFKTHDLVGALNPSERYSSVGITIPNIWENKTCSKFQTTNRWWPYLGIYPSKTTPPRPRRRLLHRQARFQWIRRENVSTERRDTQASEVPWKFQVTSKDQGFWKGCFQWEFTRYLHWIWIDVLGDLNILKFHYSEHGDFMGCNEVFNGNLRFFFSRGGAILHYWTQLP